MGEKKAALPLVYQRSNYLENTAKYLLSCFILPELSMLVQFSTRHQGYYRASCFLSLFIFQALFYASPVDLWNITHINPSAAQQDEQIPWTLEQNKQQKACKNWAGCASAVSEEKRVC